MGILEDILAKQERLEAKIETLEKELTMQRKMLLENGEMVPTAKAIEMTGITDHRTLRKHIKGWVQKGAGPIKWPKCAILEYVSKNAIAA